jgi:hypothetical protein
MSMEKMKRRSKRLLLRHETRMHENNDMQFRWIYQNTCYGLTALGPHFVKFRGDWRLYIRYPYFLASGKER